MTTPVRSALPKLLTPKGGAAPLHSQLNDKALAAVISGGASLGKGAKGTGVQQVQAALYRLGYPPGGADGQLGPNAALALLRFQTALKLPATGKIDAATLTALSIALTQLDTS